MSLSKKPLQFFRRYSKRKFSSVYSKKKNNPTLSMMFDPALESNSLLKQTQTSDSYSNGKLEGKQNLIKVIKKEPLFLEPFVIFICEV
ncbi:hypothetical protein AUF16_05180 [Enterococcus avium]|nr:hypothetical protein AUF16_05180 [Enterococcus avium]